MRGARERKGKNRKEVEGKKNGIKERRGKERKHREGKEGKGMGVDKVKKDLNENKEKVWSKIKFLIKKEG